MLIMRTKEPVASIIFAARFRLTEKVFLWVMGALFALAAVAALVDPLAAASRISGMLIEQRGTEYHVAVAIFEVAMFGVSLWLYRRIVEREQRGLRAC